MGSIPTPAIDFAFFLRHGVSPRVMWRATLHRFAERVRRLFRVLADVEFNGRIDRLVPHPLHEDLRHHAGCPPFSERIIIDPQKIAKLLRTLGRATASNHLAGRVCPPNAVQQTAKRSSRARLPSMTYLGSSRISKGKGTRQFAEQPANTLPVYPLRL